MNEIQPTLLSLDPPSARAFEAIAEYFERVYKELPMPRRGKLHLAARSSPFAAPSAERAWNLGRMVLARAAGDTSAPDQYTLTEETVAMHEGLELGVEWYHDFLAMIRSSTPRKRPRDETFRESVGALLREI